MRTGRRLARTLAFQTLFEIESRPGQVDLETGLTNRIRALAEETGTELSRESVEFAARLVRGALTQRPELDQRIARVAPAFPLDEMALTDRVALQLAVFELLHEPEVPLKVVINEAVELAKTYGGENSGRFVNGVLGTIAGERTSPGDQEATSTAKRSKNSAQRRHNH